MPSVRQKLFDNTLEDSFVSRLRQRRLQLLWSMLRTLPQPVRVLDIGGTEKYWNVFQIPTDLDLDITLVNLDGKVSPDSAIKAVVGDARNLEHIKDNAFDFVFSNSVIEHVGDYDDQKAMAKQVQRVAQHYYVQTPNYWFPIEPHFLFLGFQWLPIGVRNYLLSHFQLGYMEEVYSPEKAAEIVRTTQLLTYRKLRELFPNGAIQSERFAGLTKSWIVTSGPKLNDYENP